MFSLLLLAALVPFIASRSIEIRLPDEEVQEETPEEKFLRSDVNHDNQLTFDEFLRTGQIYVMMKKDEFQQYDTNKDGVVSRREYDDILSERKQQTIALRAQYFGRVFEEFDNDFDMKLDENEVRNVLAQRFLLKPRKNFAQTFKRFDVDGDGGLNIAEYVNFDEKVSFEEMDPIVSNTEAPVVTMKKDKLPMAKRPKRLLF